MGHFICATCNKSFESRRGGAKFCSKACYAESLKQYRDCEHCGKSFANCANVRFCSVDCSIAARTGISLSADHRQKLSESRKNSDKCKGPNLYNWKGGHAHTLRRQKAREALKRAAGELDFIYLDILLKLQKNCCYYCGKEFTQKGQKAIEHLIPITRGGTNRWENLVFACNICNSRKKAMTLAEFAIKNQRADWLNNFVQYAAYRLKQIYYENGNIENKTESKQPKSHKRCQI